MPQAAQGRRRQPPLIERDIIVRECRDDGHNGRLLIDDRGDGRPSRTPNLVHLVIVPMHNLAPDIPRQEHRVVDGDELAALRHDELVRFARNLKARCHRRQYVGRTGSLVAIRKEQVGRHRSVELERGIEVPGTLDVVALLERLPNVLDEPLRPVHIVLGRQLVLALSQQAATGLERQLIREVALDGARDHQPHIVQVAIGTRDDLHRLDLRVVPRDGMLVPAIDVLLAVVGQPDELPVPQDAPDDVIRLLLVFHVHDAGARDLGVEHVHVPRYERIHLQVEPQLHDAPPTHAGEDDRILDQRRLELHRPFGTLQVELHVLRAERRSRHVFADGDFSPRSPDDERVTRTQPAHLVHIADRQSQVQRVVGKNLAHRIDRMGGVVPSDRGIHILPTAPPQPVAPEGRLVGVGRAHAQPPRAHTVCARGRREQFVRSHAGTHHISHHHRRARDRGDLEDDIPRMQELPQHPGVAVVVLPLLVDGPDRAGRGTVYRLVELARGLADVASRDGLCRFPLRRRDVHRLQPQEHPHGVVVEDGKARGHRDTAGRRGHREVHLRVRLALERAVGRRIVRKGPARVPAARQGLRRIPLAPDIEHIARLRDGQRRSVLSGEQVLDRIRTRDRVDPRHIAVAVVGRVPGRIDDTTVDVVELEGLRSDIDVRDLHIAAIHLRHPGDLGYVHPIAVRRVCTHIGQHTRTRLRDVRDVERVLEHHPSVGEEPAVVIAKLDDIRLVEGKLEPLQPHPLVRVPRLQDVLRAGTPLRRTLRGRDEPPHTEGRGCVLVEVGATAHQRPDLATVEVDDRWVDVRHQSLTDSQEVSAIDSGGFSMAFARTASIRHRR